MIIVYSSQGCGGCALVKRILKEKGIAFQLADSFDKVIEAGLSQLPIIEVDGKFFSGSEAIDYANKL